nr:hypothetical protein [Tanacetum cinerariifolium]
MIVRMEKINPFKHQLEEGNAVTHQRYSLGEIQLKFCMVNYAMRLSFLSNTKVETCPYFNGSYHGFVWRPYKSITDLPKEENGQFDVVRQVIACEDLDNYDKNGKTGKKKPPTLLDDEGNEIICTLWDDFAQLFNDFLNTCNDHGRIILVLLLAMMKFGDGKMCIQNGYWRTKLYLFNGKECIQADEFKEGVLSIIVGNMIAIQEDEGWWYLRCRTCRTKVIKSTDYIYLESKVLKKAPDGSNDWWCRKCQAWVSLIKSQFRLQIRVHDETGIMSLSLFNDEV